MFTPVLVILLGVVGLSALTGYLDYVLMPRGASVHDLRHPTKTPSRCLQSEIQWSKNDRNHREWHDLHPAPTMSKMRQKVPGVNAADVPIHAAVAARKAL